MTFLTAFGLCVLWCIGSVVAACLAGGVFALLWFPLINFLFRYNDWLENR